MCNKFRAAGPEGRANSGQQIGLLTIKLLFHSAYDNPQDVLDISSPAAVDIGQHLSCRIKDDDSLAVCLFDHDGGIWDVCDNGVGRGDLNNIAYAAFAEDKHVVPVRLVHEYKVVSSGNLLDSMEVSAYVFWPVTNCIANIEGVERGITYTAAPCENRMKKVSV